jgi:WD40 repeat protein
VRTDLYGDSLPPGAIARIGTLRDNIGEMSGDIVLSPDGKIITATSGWFVIPLRLWDLETGRAIRHLTNLEDRAGHAKLQRVAFSPDGKLIATGNSAGVVRIGTTDTGRKIREFQWPEPVVALAFIRDGKSLAVAYGEGAIWLYRLSTGERIRSLALAPYFNLYDNVFSPDGSVVSVRRLDNSLSLRDVPTGLEIRRLWKESVPRNARTWLGGQSAGFSVGDGNLRAFSPDGKLLAFEGRHDTLRLWEVASAREIRYFPQAPLPRGPRSFVSDHSAESHLRFSPDGKLLAAGQTHFSLCLWSATTGQLYRRFPNLEIGHGIAFTPDGKRMITGGRHFRHWNIDRGKQIRRILEQDAVRSVAFGPGSKTLVTVADGATVRLWEAATGRELRHFSGLHPYVSAVAISPDGKMIAGADNKGTVILWDTATGREIRRREDYSEYPEIVFAPDGKTYAASDAQGARLWDTASGREIRRFPTSGEAARLLRFAPDGKSLAVARGDEVWLWDVATGRLERVLDETDRVHAMAFAPDGTTLATGDYCGRIRLWDPATGREIRQFGDHPEVAGEALYVMSLAFLPDGKTIAAAMVAEGDTNPSLRLFDLATGQVRRRLEGHTNSVHAFAIAPDGKTMASASADGTTLVWDLAKIAE